MEIYDYFKIWCSYLFHRIPYPACVIDSTAMAIIWTKRNQWMFDDKCCNCRTHINNLLINHPTWLPCFIHHLYKTLRIILPLVRYRYSFLIYKFQDHSGCLSQKIRIASGLRTFIVWNYTVTVVYRVIQSIKSILVCENSIIHWFCSPQVGSMASCQCHIGVFIHVKVSSAAKKLIAVTLPTSSFPYKLSLIYRQLDITKLCSKTTYIMRLCHAGYMPDACILCIF